MVRVTVCELDGEVVSLEPAWSALCEHTSSSGSELLVLPEMPFAPWLPATPEVDPAAWQEAVAAHERWLARLDELDVEVVVTSVPVVDGGRRFNEAVVWVADRGVVSRHRKTYLPDEPGFHEATWYERGAVDFAPTDTPAGRLGVAVCTEVWFTQHARALGQQGIELLAVPRATPVASIHRWQAGCRVAAIAAGAFCLSSNRRGDTAGLPLGGTSWIIDPEGEVLARTTPDTPAVTVDVDLETAARAKHTYPRYVDDSPS